MVSYGEEWCFLWLLVASSGEYIVGPILGSRKATKGSLSIFEPLRGDRLIRNKSRAARSQDQPPSGLSMMWL